MLCVPPAFAQNSTLFNFSLPSLTSQQTQVNQGRAQFSGMPTIRNGLPPTMLDSFVKEAGVHGELIYGDESFDGPPPYECFSEAHRINTGIVGTRNEGLTTGHGSLMPDAWGRDEFLGQEWSQSGARSLQSTFDFQVPFRTDEEAKFISRQFPTGHRTLDKVFYFDEDRIKPEPDYNYRGRSTDSESGR